MWDRKILKEKGKAAYAANRVTCIIAALLLLLAGGAGNGITGPAGTYNFSRNFSGGNDAVYDDYDDYYDSYDDSYDEWYDDYDDDFYGEESDGAVDLIIDEDDMFSDNNGIDSYVPMVIFSVVLLVMVLIAIAVGVLIGALLLNPLRVGLTKFFIDNSSNPSVGLDRNNIGVGFGPCYGKVVGAMFTTGLFTFFWSLLLIIPGIIKAYTWRMVPYIVGENPSITGREARDMSAEMMYGSKWDAFVFDLSFIGWRLLGALTFGILNIVFTNPYQAATNAELYLALKGIMADAPAAAPSSPPQAAPAAAPLSEPVAAAPAAAPENDEVYFDIESME